MKNLEQEECINRKIRNKELGRKIIAVEKSRWGELILPGKGENPEKTDDGIRILVFGSYLLGYVLFEALKEMERKFPEKLNIVGLVTDDPANPHAKISLKRRIWRFYDQKGREDLEVAMIESALTYRVPCYTGEVKTDYFRELLSEWKPDAIIVAVFGQLIDFPIIQYPSYGIYNFHPSDLAHHFGVGPRPYEDLIERKASESRVTIHYVTEEVDGGHIVGQSPPINVTLKNGEISKNNLVLDDKMRMPVDHMAVSLVSALIRKKDTGEIGPIDRLDFEELFSGDLKKKLMEPILENKHSENLPLLDENLNFF